MDLSIGSLWNNITSLLNNITSIITDFVDIFNLIVNFLPSPFKEILLGSITIIIIIIIWRILK